MIKLWGEYLKNQLKCLIKYRMTFWASIFNIAIKTLAMGMVWQAVYKQQGIQMQYNVREMLIYSTTSIALAQCMTWWDGPHMYTLNSVKKGTIIFDVIRSINFFVQLFCRGSSEFLLNLFVYFFPTMCFGNLVFDLQIKLDRFVIMFFISVILGYLILFGFQLLLSMVSVIMLELDGILLLFHAVVMLLACETVPLEMYPVLLQKVIVNLPFRYIFYFPLTIIIEKINLDTFINSIIVEIAWIFLLFIIIGFGWNKIKKHICIQGG